MMKRLIFCLISIILLLPLFSQGLKEENLIEIKDEVLSERSYIPPMLTLTFDREDEITKREILNIDTDEVPSSLIMKYSSMDGKASVEYSSSYLYYSLELLEDKVELKVTEEGVSLFLNDKLVGGKALSENILLVEEAFSNITEILSSPDNFEVTEIKKYYGDNWESTLYWPIEERSIKAEIKYTDSNNSLWFISGHIEKDKITETFSPLNIFVAPYFVLEDVEKDGEERDRRLW